MTPKSLGFKFQPGDKVRVLGTTNVLTVQICRLDLIGVSCEKIHTYVLSFSRLSMDDKIVTCPEALLEAVPAINEPTHEPR